MQGCNSELAKAACFGTVLAVLWAASASIGAFQTLTRKKSLFDTVGPIATGGLILMFAAIGFIVGAAASWYRRPVIACGRRVVGWQANQIQGLRPVAQAFFHMNPALPAAAPAQVVRPGA